MSEIIDRKYIALLSPKLDRFKQTGRDSWNFRCPVCGDSKKSQIKARGYLFAKGGRVFYHCHNCQVSLSFNTLLKSMDESLYRDYLLDTFGPPKKQDPKITQDETKVDMNRFFKRELDIPRISELPVDHPAVMFLTKRKIPNKYFSELFYADDFKLFVDEFWPENNKKLLEQEHRIVIPFIDAAGSILGIQGRSLSNDGIRYITIKPNADSAKVFGLNRLDFDKTIYVFEGPFDSLFIDNGLATMDSALYTAPHIINHPNGDYVFVYDNEPRNKEVLKSMRKSIKLNQNIVIWPREVDGFKDANKMVEAGIDVTDIIKYNYFDGLHAELEFEKWRMT